MRETAKAAMMIALTRNEDLICILESLEVVMLRRVMVVGRALSSYLTGCNGYCICLFSDPTAIMQQLLNYHLIVSTSFAVLQTRDLGLYTVYFRA
jgi:hypothetical protein